MLARPPAPPVEVGRFSADCEAGPGVYPQGPPMRPARGPGWTAGSARSAITEVFGPREERASAMAAFDSPALARRAPDPGVRAALAMLVGTPGEPVVRAVADGATPSLRYGAPASASRVVGLGRDGDSRVRLVNVRYRAEHPAIVSGSLVHALLATTSPRGQAQEALLHALLGMVHLQILVRAPHLAGLGTELSRRQNTLALALINSRPAGEPGVRIIAPTGAGTAPGGDPRMQTPDFWSIPFGPDEPRSAPAPALLGAVLARLLPGSGPPPEPLTYDERLIRWLDANLDAGWLGPAERVRAAVALGAIDPAAT